MVDIASFGCSMVVVFGLDLLKELIKETAETQVSKSVANIGLELIFSVCLALSS